jgi:hypothetical protein
MERGMAGRFRPGKMVGAGLAGALGAELAMDACSQRGDWALSRTSRAIYFKLKWSIVKFHSFKQTSSFDKAGDGGFYFRQGEGGTSFGSVSSVF